MHLRARSRRAARSRKGQPMAGATWTLPRVARSTLLGGANRHAPTPLLRSILLQQVLRGLRAPAGAAVGLSATQHLLKGCSAAHEPPSASSLSGMPTLPCCLAVAAGCQRSVPLPNIACVLCCWFCARAMLLRSGRAGPGAWPCWAQPLLLLLHSLALSPLVLLVFCTVRTQHLPRHLLLCLPPLFRPTSNRYLRQSPAASPAQQCIRAPTSLAAHALREPNQFTLLSRRV